MIYFVGAGAGAPDLITVRGQSLLQKADMVIYAGSLVNPALLGNCPSHCEILDSASMTLEEVVTALLRANHEGATVIRLHTGDPSLYGAIREQMDMLREQNVEFSIVPGVSSFFAAAAALEAEYTLPGVSQTVIISRMAGRTPVPEKENIQSLASHQATMVLFLSVNRIHELCEQLIEGGYSQDTPAAIVYKASWPEQKIVRGTLTTLPALAKGIEKTALVVVGHVLEGDYEKSKLYDATFTHGYREASK